MQILTDTTREITEQSKILTDAAREVTVSRAAAKVFGGLGHTSCGESSCLKLTFWREKQLDRTSISGSKYWQDKAISFPQCIKVRMHP